MKTKRYGSSTSSMQIREQIDFLVYHEIEGKRISEVLPHQDSVECYHCKNSVDKYYSAIKELNRQKEVVINLLCPIVHQNPSAMAVISSNTLSLSQCQSQAQIMRKRSCNHDASSSCPPSSATNVVAAGSSSSEADCTPKRHKSSVKVI